ncbi:hypothetical protein I5R65_07330 [Herbaspirillum sp. AP02]|uniref:hypothetical protein n=1 Tax=unclassified Herbaspirillum TaxID=2624150 RepID=UPI0015D99048|nr:MULTISPECIES: hypothetical protein [unclassified Herbaspirillum]MBG7619272.1 hypothetical protein [Herbaspirillum sp. AP02]NZD66556.1 hypothetical protein [Herbaspirillum sp. AP21]
MADAYFNLAQIEISRMRYADATRWIDVLMTFAPQHVGALTARRHDIGMTPAQYRQDPVR